jgi:hypothetical protein
MKLLTKQIDNSIEELLGNSGHKLYYSLYDTMADLANFSDAAASHKDLAFYDHFYFLTLSKDALDIKEDSLDLTFDLVIRSNLGLFMIKCISQISKDPVYQIEVEIVDFKIDSLVPEPIVASS